MTSHRLLHVASLMLLAFSTGLAGCAPSEGSDDDEPSAASSEDMLSGAGIVPQASIRGIKLGMTKSQVRSVLGKPDKVETWGTGAAANFHYGQTRAQFGDADGRVVIVRTTSQGVRTQENVGVGSLRLNVDALPDAQCSSRKTDVDGEVVYRHECAISSAQALTRFDFPPTGKEAFDANAKVVSVELWKR